MEICAKCVKTFAKLLGVLCFQKMAPKAEVQMLFVRQDKGKFGQVWGKFGQRWRLVCFDLKQMHPQSMRSRFLWRLFFGVFFGQVWGNVGKNPSHP